MPSPIAPRICASLAILLLLWTGQRAGQAASSPSDWPSINADASQSNANGVEKGITTKNALKLKALWTVPIPDLSYPIVAGGKVYVPVTAGSAIHVKALDATTGKVLQTYGKGAGGGLLLAGGDLYLAGKSLDVLDPSTGNKVAEIKGTSTSGNASFTYPIADGKLMVTGYSSNSQSVPNSIYAIDPVSRHVVWHSPSTNAQGALAHGKVLTLTGTGSVFYNATNGQSVVSQKSLFSDWFAGSSLLYTVASIGKGDAALYAFDSAGKKMWSHTVGPRLNATGWPHAVDGNAVYVATLKPHEGVEAIDPTGGKVLWTRPLPGVQRLAVANNLLFVLTSSLGQPLHLVILRTKTDKALGQITLSSGYYAFPATNELMIADGMVFLRAIGPGNVTQLVALGP